MKKMDIEELKRCQIEILDYVANFCDSNRIRYWLDCGTLLGAIRHHGYIPWDDDIDIGMLREDYDKFVSLFINRDDCKYRLFSIENNKNFFAPFAKITDTQTVLYEPNEKGLKTAVNIDVFPYDNAPDDDRLVFRQFRMRNFYRSLNQIKISRFFPEPLTIKKLVKILAYYPVNLFPDGFFIRKMVENAKKYSNCKTKRVASLIGIAPVICDRELFNSFIEVQFEGKTYKAPSEYDTWLKILYGDYMKLPPVEKRYSHHSFVAYSLNHDPMTSQPVCYKSPE